MWWSERRTAPRRTLFIKVNHEDFVWLGIPLKVATDSCAKAVWLDEQPEAEVQALPHFGWRGGAYQFREAVLTDADVQAVQVRVRQRVLRWFARQGYLDREDAKDMAEWRNGGGFSIDASVRIEADDRAGLERPLRYCARPPFALERLEAIDAHRLMYHLPKAQPNGRTELMLTPWNLSTGWRR